MENFILHLAQDEEERFSESYERGKFLVEDYDDFFWQIVRVTRHVRTLMCFVVKKDNTVKSTKRKHKEFFKAGDILNHGRQNKRLEPALKNKIGNIEEY